MLFSKVNFEKRLNLVDRLGVLASGVCLVHCLAIPGMTILSSLNAFSGSEEIHIASLVCVWVISYFAFFRKKNFHFRVAIKAILGLLLMTSVLLFEFLHIESVHDYALFLNLIGSSLLIYSHLINGRCSA